MQVALNLMMQNPMLVSLSMDELIVSRPFERSEILKAISTITGGGYGTWSQAESIDLGRPDWLDEVLKKSTSGSGSTLIGSITFEGPDKTEVSVKAEGEQFRVFLGGIPESFSLELAESELFQFDC